MAHTETLHAIVLQTYNVGEADRFCILLTRERGKIAARARGVRKMQSRMGGSLMQGMRVLVDIHQGSAGALITGVKQEMDSDRDDMPLSGFVAAQEGIELLLAVVHDEEPLPEIYDATLRFLAACATQQQNTLPFMIALLNHMGLLPEESHTHFENLSATQKSFLKTCVQEDTDYPPLNAQEHRTLFALCTELFNEHTTRPLKATHVGGSILMRPALALAVQPR